MMLIFAHPVSKIRKNRYTVFFVRLCWVTIQSIVICVHVLKKLILYLLKNVLNPVAKLICCIIRHYVTNVVVNSQQVLQCLQLWENCHNLCNLHSLGHQKEWKQSYTHHSILYLEHHHKNNLHQYQLMK